jgi:hypothetical protein
LMPISFFFSIRIFATWIRNCSDHRNIHERTAITLTLSERRSTLVSYDMRACVRIVYMCKRAHHVTASALLLVSRQTKTRRNRASQPVSQPIVCHVANARVRVY